MSDSSTALSSNDAQAPAATAPEPALSLSEFVSALRAEFPGADVVDERTISPQGRLYHAASLVVDGLRFGVRYRLDPLLPVNRWVSSWVFLTAPTPSGLRPHLALAARERAKRARAGAEEWAIFAEKLPGAALYFEGATPPAPAYSFASLDAAVEVFKKEVRGVASGQRSVYAASMAMRLVFSEMKEDCEVALEANRAQVDSALECIFNSLRPVKSPPVAPPTPPPSEADEPEEGEYVAKPMSISQFSEVDAELVARGFEPGHRVRREIYGHDHAWFWTRGRVKLYCDGDLENWCIYLDGREIVNSGPSSSHWVGTLANARATFYADAALFNVSV